LNAKLAYKMFGQVNRDGDQRFQQTSMRMGKGPTWIDIRSYLAQQIVVARLAGRLSKRENTFACPFCLPFRYRLLTTRKRFSTLILDDGFDCRFDRRLPE
jgi:hypothetical protein